MGGGKGGEMLLGKDGEGKGFEVSVYGRVGGRGKGEMRDVGILDRLEGDGGRSEGGGYE